LHLNSFGKTASKLIAIFFLGLFVAAQVTFSPFIDNSIESFLRSSVGLELPHELKMIPFKSVLIFWLLILSLFILRRFIRTGIVWLFERKEKVFVTFLLLSTQFMALTPGRLEINDFALLAVVFLWFPYIVLNKEYKIIWSPRYTLLLLFLLSVFLSVFIGGRQSANRLPGNIKNVAFFFLLVNIIRERETAISSLKIFLSITTFSAIIGVLQEIIYLLTGVVIVGFVQERAKQYMWESTPLGNLIRVPALTGWYVILANVILIALVIGVNLILYSVITKERERLFFYIAMLIMAVALFLTFSHSTILVLLLAIIVSILIRWRSLSIHFVTIFLVVILIAYFSGFLTDFAEQPKRYIMTEDVSTRLELLRDGIAGFFNRHPFIGNGIGKGRGYTSNIDGWPVHNNIVLVADELGLLGILIYGSLFFVLIYRQAVFVLKLKNKRDKAISLSVFIGLIFYLTNLLAQAQDIDIFIFTYFGLTEAIIRSLSHPVTLESSAQPYV